MQNTTTQTTMQDRKPRIRCRPATLHPAEFVCFINPKTGTRYTTDWKNAISAMLSGSEAMKYKGLNDALRGAVTI